MTAPTEAPAATAVANLAARALAAPPAPWLFYRRSWDWQWRSWRRVADQVARGAEVLRGWDPGCESRIAFAAGQDPDAVAIGLAIEAVGAIAVPVAGEERGALEAAARSGCAAWVGIAGDMPTVGFPEALESIALPPARAALDRTRRLPLELDQSSRRGRLASPASTAAPLPAEALIAAARTLDRGVPSSPRRAIACAAPDLDSTVFHLLQAWTLVRGAAWVLEPYPDAFLATVLWARPTVVFAPAAELEPLATALADRRHRRHSRLTTIVVAGEQPADAAVWAPLPVELVALGENPLQSLSGGAHGAAP